MRFGSIGVAALLAIQVAASPAATSGGAVVYPNLLANPGFENTGFGETSYFYNIGRDHATPADFGWTANNIDIVKNNRYGPSSLDGSGKYSVDLVGFGTQGSIEQTIETTIGLNYTLAFDYANNAHAKGTTAIVKLNSTTLATLTGTNAWLHFSQTFVATSASYLINIASIGDHNSGTLIDNVSFVDPPSVPEPAAWVMMALGFGLVGITRRRRSQAVTTAS